MNCLSKEKQEEEEKKPEEKEHMEMKIGGKEDRKMQMSEGCLGAGKYIVCTQEVSWL